MNKFHSEFVWVPRKTTPNVGNEGKKEEEWKWNWGGKRDASEVRQGQGFADDERYVCVVCWKSFHSIDISSVLQESVKVVRLMTPLTNLARWGFKLDSCQEWRTAVIPQQRQTRKKLVSRPVSVKPLTWDFTDCSIFQLFSNVFLCCLQKTEITWTRTKRTCGACLNERLMRNRPSLKRVTPSPTKPTRKGPVSSYKLPYRLRCAKLYGELVAKH